MKILLTGATGFIGSTLAEELAKSGHQVKALIRNPKKLRWPIDKVNGIELVKGDITHPEGLEEAAKEVEVIIHAAGMTKALKHEDYYLANAKSCEFLLNARDKKTFKQFIFFSTQAAIGPANGGVPKKENEPANPVSRYGITKLKGEEIVVQSGVNYTIFRFPPVYGERDTEFYPLFKSIRKGWKLILGTGLKKVNMIYVKDVINGIQCALGNEKAYRQIYHIHDGNAYNWFDINNAAEKASGRKCRTLRIPMFSVYVVGTFNTLIEKIFRKPLLLNREKLREMKVENWLLDITKIRNELGFKPEYHIEEGFKNTFRWYVDNGWIKKMKS